MENKRILALALLLALVFSGCSTETISCPPENGTTNADVISCEPVLIPDTDATFADNLMKLTKDDGNRMVSPYSAKMCLALLANGAKDETKQQILDAIGISDLDAYNTYVKETLERYETYAGVLALNTANSLWVNKSVHDRDFLPDYRDNMQDFYSAEVREVTIDNSIEEVNAWAKEKTNGKIDSIFTEDHREFALALANAVYFKAAWEIPFEKYATKKQDFTDAYGLVSKLDFMNATDRFGYYEADGVKAVSLEYGKFGEKDGKQFYLADKNYSFSMYFILAENELDVEKFLNENTPFTTGNVHVSIPKFELEYKIQLNDILMALGMENAFDDRADLSGLTGVRGLAVDDVLQKTYIKIDEEGTEAAAVTAIAIDECAYISTEAPKEFIADRPFYFAIRDNTSGELLFVGRYETSE
ncbi:MAG: serpin family protein [Clostridia bacterium]|nr:serpin family protein [Clostridia bacterium]